MPIQYAEREIVNILYHNNHTVINLYILKQISPTIKLNPLIQLCGTNLFTYY